ncbi:unnamed protein product [Adineta steineri]|uniref:Uncharacterized protein n=1 Tax=Adineta steineri TaxID=433720 RepID=A0A813UCL2_9BILA|nr:unnamed protein product [Adineta steineri]CAF0839373.1 unnamed protein product [Adineta steineri]
MCSITFIYVCFLALLPLTVQHQCVQYCIVYLSFDEIFDKLPPECIETKQDTECYTDIGFDYGKKSIQIKFGEHSVNGSAIESNDYFISQETEMWHETYDLQWTTVTHICYQGDFCDFEYVKTKLLQMRQLTTNFNQFEKKLASTLFETDSDPSIIRCLSVDGHIITCAENIKSCTLNIDNIYANKSHQSCSSQSDDRLRKQLGIKEATSHYLNGKVDARQSSVEYVCNHELCNGLDVYKNVIQLLMEYNLIRNDTHIQPSSTTSSINKSLYKILLLIPFIFYVLFYQ